VLVQLSCEDVVLKAQVDLYLLELHSLSWLTLSGDHSWWLGGFRYFIVFFRYFCCFKFLVFLVVFSNLPFHNLPYIIHYISISFTYTLYIYLPLKKKKTSLMEIQRWTWTKQWTIGKWDIQNQVASHILFFHVYASFVPCFKFQRYIKVFNRIKYVKVCNLIWLYSNMGLVNMWCKIQPECC
jgi:hypothetical protein